jgi:hypothetical protein
MIAHAKHTLMPTHQSDPTSLASLDARRPPVKDGRLLYSAEACDAALAAAVAASAGGKLGPRYFGCREGAGCRRAHGLLEILYHPVRLGG